VGFSFDITGRTAREAAEALASLDWHADLMGDHLGDQVRELATVSLLRAGDPGPTHQYRVKAEGHSNITDRHSVRLSLSISIEPTNAEESPEPEKDEDMTARRDQDYRDYEARHGLGTMDQPFEV
jgi:hypothetical protein